MLPANPLYACVEAFVNELGRAGVRDVVICPGSRSTPLALAFAEQNAIHVWMHVDERSAAFFALGMAREQQTPVAIVSTSGTAAANFYPAIVEANLTHIPLLVLTADRPHELRDVGAPQTINQIHLYSTHVKRFTDVAIPEASIPLLRYWRALAGRAVSEAGELPAGPVHLNFPFREPLVPVEEAYDTSTLAMTERSDDSTYTRVIPLIATIPPAPWLDDIEQLIQTKERGLIIVGPQPDAKCAHAIASLAFQTDYPVLADPLSQMRGYTGEGDEHVLVAYDAYLRVDNFIAESQPEVILRIGPMPVSKPLSLYLQRYSNCPQIVLDPRGNWEDPSYLSSVIAHVDIEMTCNMLCQALEARRVTKRQSNQWLESWQTTERVARDALAHEIRVFTQPFEGRIMLELAELLPPGSLIFAGNSMPIRDLDTFFWPKHEMTIRGNRGANGIDGIISSALGASVVHGRPTILVIGDLSFYHDMNGLLAAKLHELDLTIVLVNNNGGGIFSFLSQADFPDHFEQVFGTPTGLDFQHAALLYDAQYTRPTSWHAFRDAVQQGLRDGGLHVVEVQTERSANVSLHRQLWRVIEAELSSIALIPNEEEKE
jgi:2-succinyl-5-enolpyruvyl-6-hydroxy-3-cyclohexene-1-carboxylate synthase